MQKQIKKRLKGGLNPELSPRIDKIKRIEVRLFDETGNSAFIWETLSAEKGEGNL